MNYLPLKKFVLSTFALLLFSSVYGYSVNESDDDKKITIRVGKKLATLDDVRLGDYTIKVDESVSSTAQEELRDLLHIFLTLKNQPSQPNISLAELVKSAMSVSLTLSKKKRVDEILWNADDQKMLDEEIAKNHDALIKLELSKHQKALVEYIRAQYLFTNKKIDQGLNVLSSVIQTYAGTLYEVRARGERVFRLFLAKRYHEVLSEAAIIVQQHPNTREAQDAIYFIGRSYFQIGDYAQAAKYLEQVATQYPASKWLEGAKYFTAKSKHYLKNYSESIRDFENFISEYPQSVYKDDARELIASGYVHQKKLDKAIQSYEQYKKENQSLLEFIAAEKRMTLYASTQATASRRKGKENDFRYYDSIVQAFPKKMESLMKLHPTDDALCAQALFALYNYYINEGNDLGRAVTILEKIYSTPRYLTMESNNKDCATCNQSLLYKPMILQRLMIAYVRSGKTSTVIPYKEELLKKGNLTNYYELVLEELKTLYQQKKETNPEYFKQHLLPIANNIKLIESLRAEALFILADILAHEGKKKEAVEMYSKIVLEFPTSPHAPISKTLSSIYQKY